MFRYVLQNKKTKKYYQYSMIYMSGSMPQDVISISLAKKFGTLDEAQNFNKEDLHLEYSVKKIL